MFMHGRPAGVLEELEGGKTFLFSYFPGYPDPPVSLTMPVKDRNFRFEGFPPFFEGLLPEGIMLEGLLRRLKIDRADYLSQLVATGQDLVGAVTCEWMKDE